MSVGRSFYEFIVGFGDFCYSLFTRLGSTISGLNTNLKDFFKNEFASVSPFSLVMSEFVSVENRVQWSFIKVESEGVSSLVNFLFNWEFALGDTLANWLGFDLLVNNGLVVMVMLIVPLSWFLLIWRGFKKSVLGGLS